MRISFDSFGSFRVSKNVYVQRFNPVSNNLKAKGIEIRFCLSYTSKQLLQQGTEFLLRTQGLPTCNIHNIDCSDTEYTTTKPPVSKDCNNDFYEKANFRVILNIAIPRIFCFIFCYWVDYVILNTYGLEYA